MINFQAIEELFNDFKVLDLPKKHQSNNSRWDMVEYMSKVVKMVQSMVLATNFIWLSVDEVTIVDNQSWLYMHGYMVKNWRRVSILLSLQRIDGGNNDNLTKVILSAAMQHACCIEAKVAEKLMCFDVDSVVVFQGARVGVITQL